ncbi:hypothetical protein [Clostridium intestinale]|uniref:hypothetical protein n=1 Tax=Clostridium intestinale TaxID=36845 RepID=UPI0028F15A49|nr:hypothetical protein [Clostridium intestinale]
MKIISKPIDMVAWFDKTGKAHPVRFRFEDENGEFKSIVVGKVLNIDLEKLCGNPARVFTCQSNIDGVTKLYEIKFILGTSQWLLFKI